VVQQQGGGGAQTRDPNKNWALANEESIKKKVLALGEAVLSA